MEIWVFSVLRLRNELKYLVFDGLPLTDLESQLERRERSYYFHTAVLDRSSGSLTIHLDCRPLLLRRD